MHSSFKPSSDARWAEPMHTHTDTFLSVSSPPLTEARCVLSSTLLAYALGSAC